MGTIEKSADGNLEVTLANEVDAAQLRAAIKASDGADEITPEAGHTHVLSGENVFNFIALWATDLEWSPAALRLALDALVPMAQGSVHLHTRSRRRMMRLMAQEASGAHRPPGPPPA